MRLNITHETRFTYDKAVPYGLLQMRLTPKTRKDQKIIEWDTTISGGKSEVRFEDHNHNMVDLVSMNEGESAVTIVNKGIVETTNNNGIIGEHGGYAPLWLFKRTTDLTKQGSGVQRLVKSLGEKYDNDVLKLHELSNRINSAVEYEGGFTDAKSTAEEAISAGHGVCQDHAHIFISAARMMGFPTRYVSGYLMMNDRVEQDASHAWAEAYCENIGWVGFDVSNGISPDERYVRIATGLDYKEAAPLSGIRLGSSGESIQVAIQVQQ